MIRDLLRMGNARLLQRSLPIAAFDTAELQALIDDLQDTMAAAGGVGLAAPQIGVPLRVVIFGFSVSVRYPKAEAVPFTVLCNPTLTALNDVTEEDWEGCLSVPGLRGRVPRYTGFDPYGQPIDRTVSGFHARVVQHECDHLDGVLYPTRIRDLRQFGFQDALFPDHPDRAA